MGAIPYQKTPTSDVAWDAGANVKDLKSGQDAGYYRKMFAWVDPDGNEKTKGAYKFPHHEVGTNGDIGAANVNACQSVISVLNGGMGGASIPDGDKQSVYDHASQHLKDAGVTPAEFKKSSERPQHLRSIVTAKFQVRAEGNGDSAVQYIEGYALKFGVRSNDIGFFMPLYESIDAHALDQCDMSDVMCLFNHNPNSPLARNTVQSGPGALQLSVDNIGLHFKSQPTGTSYAADLIQNIQAGVINQCSFAFDEPDDDDAETVEFDKENGCYTRTINKISVLYDVSPVTYPAYSETDCTVGDRCMRKLRSLHESLERSNKPTKSDLELEMEKFKAFLL